MVGAGARTGLLFVAIVAVFVVAGTVIGQLVFGGAWQVGLVIALVLSLLMNLVSYFLCDRFVLWANHARLVTEAEAPRLSRIVKELAPQFGLEAPRVAIIPTQTMNAFATGRNPRHAVVAATEGILRQLDDRELRGVLAHELAHVKDRDILLMTFAATLAGAITYLAEMYFFNSLFGGNSNQRGGGNSWVAVVALITAPIAAMLLQLAISRSRESRADEVGAMTIHDPNSLADALQKLEASNTHRPMATASAASSSLYIVNPFRGVGIARLFSTHPPTAERIRRLRAMAHTYTYQPTIRAPPLATARGRPARS